MRKLSFDERIRDFVGKNQNQGRKQVDGDEPAVCRQGHQACETHGDHSVAQSTSLVQQYRFQFRLFIAQRTTVSLRGVLMRDVHLKHGSTWAYLSAGDTNGMASEAVLGTQ